MHDFSHDDRHREILRANLDAFDRADPLVGERYAAVAVTLVEQEDGETGFVITRRAATLRNHSGQWALPGGRIDDGETVEQAALRELAEEVGVVVDDSAILGRLDDFATRSGFVISPIVVWAGAVELTPNPDEVDLAIPLPVRDLNRDDAPIVESIPASDRPLIMMPLMGSVVFAPTAAILYQFREVALRGESTRVAHYEQPPFAWR